MSFTKPAMKHIKSKVASDTVVKSASRMGVSSAKSYPTPKVVKNGKKHI